VKQTSGKSNQFTFKNHDMNVDERLITDRFHNLYYDGPMGVGPIFNHTSWMGVPCQKCPLDLWIYQEIIFELQPDLIIETGTCYGGSALFMAHILDIIGKGKIITIDIDNTITRPSHPRIVYVHGSSSDAGLVESILTNRPDEVRLVILDSDHSKAHVLQELHLFAPYVNVGSYLIVEDTNINGHPAYPSFGEGPYEAVQEFLAIQNGFTIDLIREKFLMTFNPAGFLKRIA
jgi:cephalosporin hydroxylase